MDSLYLVAGLGNPGVKYAQTRHNAGFMVVERFVARWKGTWKDEGRFQARVARIDGEKKLLVCEPQTYMNSSGEAIAGLARFYKIPLAQIIVSVDDADLPLGQIRLRPKGSSGGHHGLESINEQLGSNDYARQRVGIGRTDACRREITDYVLGRFQSGEAELLEKALDRAVSQLDCWLSSGIQKAMSQFNGAVEGPAQKES